MISTFRMDTKKLRKQEGKKCSLVRQDTEEKNCRQETEIQFKH